MSGGGFYHHATTGLTTLLGETMSATKDTVQSEAFSGCLPTLLKKVCYSLPNGRKPLILIGSRERKSFPHRLTLYQIMLPFISRHRYSDNCTYSSSRFRRHRGTPRIRESFLLLGHLISDIAQILLRSSFLHRPLMAWFSLPTKKTCRVD